MKGESFQIQRAERRHSRLRLAVAAASNGGKTYTSIELAFGIVEEYLRRGLLQGTLEGKVGVVDTEHKSAQLYAHLGPYDSIDLEPPYTVARYTGALSTFERAGYFVVILDSISHAWAGAGGLLSVLAAMEQRDRFSGFNTDINPHQNEFVDAMLRSPCHIIATMRSKTEWVLEDKEKRGRDGSVRTVKEPRRIGMAPIQRPGIEYEFTTLLDLDTDTHVARVLKNRSPVFTDWVPRVLDRKDGYALAAWMLEAKPEPRSPAEDPGLVAVALRDTSVAAMARCSNMPDLERVFADAYRRLNTLEAQATEAGQRATIDGVRSHVVLEKDRRKAALGAPLPSIPAGEPISPDECVLLETTLSEYGIPFEAFKAWAGVARLAQFPAARWVEGALWISVEAGKRGYPIQPLGRPRPRAEAPVRTAQDVIAGVVEKQAASRPGLFSDMTDDVPQ